MTIIARLPRRIPGLRLLWCPLALGIALLAFALAGMLKLPFLDFDGSRPLAAAICCVGVLLALSALPFPAVDPRE
ncbi:MAG: hypothetical protein K2Y56_18100 [Methylobacterium sp.]|uniref:hypothetical protein n=1 Tax=Methylobacterium sp. TaxID=409 RepID=UPI0025FDCEC5|nr:hypothetical protein [Methylobacterium sp.]MBX9933419.1 hypothetical protein [Methylobacterium sp.]